MYESVTSCIAIIPSSYTTGPPPSPRNFGLGRPPPAPPLGPPNTSMASPLAQPYFDTPNVVWSPAPSSETVDWRCPSRTPPSTPSLLSISLSTASPSSHAPSPVQPRRHMVPSQLEEFKEEILGLYRATTNTKIRKHMEAQHGLWITEKQLKRQLRLWKAYKNTRGKRAATVSRPKKEARRKSAGRRMRASAAIASSPPEHVVHESSGSGSESEVDHVQMPHIHLQISGDEDGDMVAAADSRSSGLLLRSGVSTPGYRPRASRVVGGSASGPKVGGIGSSMEASRFPTAPSTSLPFFEGQSQSWVTFNTPLRVPPRSTPSGPHAVDPHRLRMNHAAASPAGLSPPAIDMIPRLLAEIVDRFDSTYGLGTQEDKSHWDAYNALENYNEQSLRQGIIIAEAMGDIDQLQEVLKTYLVPMFQTIDILGIAGLFSVFTVLKNHQFITAVMQSVRRSLPFVPETFRQNVEHINLSFSNLLAKHNFQGKTFHTEIRSFMQDIAKHIRRRLGRRSLVGVYLMVLFDIGDYSDILKEAEACATSSDIRRHLHTVFLLAARLMSVEGETSARTRECFSKCYSLAEDFNAMLDKDDIPEDDPLKQEAFYFLGRVGLDKVKCDDHSRQVLEGYLAPRLPPPVRLLEQSVFFAERYTEGGPENSIYVQGLKRLVEMYNESQEFVMAEMTSLRLDALPPRRDKRHLEELQ